MKYCNTYDFDYTENYMALLACIVSELTVDECVRKIALQHKRDQRKKSAKRIGNKNGCKKTYVFDIEANEMHEFNSGKEAAQQFGMNPAGVGFYIQNEYKYKHRYIFTRNKDFEYKGK
nr:hypothetical protein [[Eubacterium] tenue]